MPDLAALTQGKADWGLAPILAGKHILAQAYAIDGTIPIELHRSRFPQRPLRAYASRLVEISKREDGANGFRN